MNQQNRRPTRRRRRTRLSVLGIAVVTVFIAALLAIAVYFIFRFENPCQSQTSHVETTPAPTLAPTQTPPHPSPGPDATTTPEDNNNNETTNNDTTSASRFAAFSFFDPAREEEYYAFAARRPELTDDEVVWMVNVHLNQENFYDVIFTIPATDTMPLLVNPVWRLPDGFEPDNMVGVNNDDDNIVAIPEAVAAFRSLRSASRAAGFDLSITSGFRTAERQATLFERQQPVDTSRPMAVAKPHHSEHQTGRALDIWGPGSGLMDSQATSSADLSPVGTWVYANAHVHGFIIRYGYDVTHITGFIFEPWHITYVGIHIAQYMHDMGIRSLEEFVGRNPNATIANFANPAAR